MVKVKYSRRIAGLFMMVAGMFSLWGCANYYGGNGSASEKYVSESDTEDGGV